MKEFEGIIGHENHVRYLQNLTQKEVVPHAFLFVGSRGVGKTTLVQAFINSLISGKGSVDLESQTSKNFFDIAYVDLAEDKKEISVTQIRELLEKLTLTSAQGGHKFAVVMNAQALNASASNALLKFLEEPPAHTHLLLLATSKDHMLPTIISRCVTLTLLPVARNVLEEQLRTRFPESAPQTITQCVLLAQGLPGNAISYLRDPSRVSEIEVLARDLTRALLGAAHEQSAYIASIIDESSWTHVATLVALDLLAYASHARENLLLPNLGDMYEKITSQRKNIAVWCQGVIEYDKIHAYSGNKQLFLENLFFNL
ncbi:AAA family ATPase [Candidatus Falkowbacteria bacterium]|nr:AAA family ATPase [Candidatus Falkowbacteria bacterium]